MIYDYQCKCGNVQEEIHGMNEVPEIKCTKCSTVMQRIISGGSGVIFKGGGWTTSDSKFKQSMLKKNDKMAKKSQAHIRPVHQLGDLQ